MTPLHGEEREKETPADDRFLAAQVNWSDTSANESGGGRRGLLIEHVRSALTDRGANKGNQSARFLYLLSRSPHRSIPLDSNTERSRSSSEDRFRWKRPLRRMMDARLSRQKSAHPVDDSPLEIIGLTEQHYGHISQRKSLFSALLELNCERWWTKISTHTH